MILKISAQIFISLEELCFYLYNNACLIDETLTKLSGFWTGCGMNSD